MPRHPSRVQIYAVTKPNTPGPSTLYKAQPDACPLLKEKEKIHTFPVIGPVEAPADQ